MDRPGYVYGSQRLPEGGTFVQIRVTFWSMLVAIVPMIVLIVGLLTWFVSANPKVSEAGKIGFSCGLLVVTMICGREMVKLL
jgi:hypothetical protein